MAHQKGEISIRTATFPQSHFYRAGWISGCRGRCSGKVKVAPGTALSFHRGATSPPRVPRIGQARALLATVF
ncbi:Uncharacterized protein HZ326_2644 [Fusarium oxysporum f. sp. albedinis]|nr:Uncharacterized protein HZ326_2644 [Fusarium oxysporum f. sp. albedinis]